MVDADGDFRLVAFLDFKVAFRKCRSLDNFFADDFHTAGILSFADNQIPFAADFLDAYREKAVGIDVLVIHWLDFQLGMGAAGFYSQFFFHGKVCGLYGSAVGHFEYNRGCCLEVSVD